MSAYPKLAADDPNFLLHAQTRIALKHSSRASRLDTVVIGSVSGYLAARDLKSEDVCIVSTNNQRLKHVQLVNISIDEVLAKA